MIELTARIELRSGWMETNSNVRSVVVNADVGDNEYNIRIEEDQDLKEVRVIIDDECVWSALSGG